MMKKMTLIAASVFFLACITANAQMHQGGDAQSGQQKAMMPPCMMKGGMGPMHQGMMQKGMMQEGMMMAKPMKKYKMMVHMLPRMQAQLSLSQEQTGELIDLQANFQKKQVDYKAQLAKKKMKVQGLLDKEAAADEVKDQLKACADIKVEMHAAAYETALEMKGVLDDAQIKKMEDFVMQHGDMSKCDKKHGQGGMKKKMMSQ